MVREQSIPGVYVIPSAQSSLCKIYSEPFFLPLFAETTSINNFLLCFILVWFGVVFVRKGVYQGGVFRFTLFIPENFPDTKSPPVSG